MKTLLDFTLDFWVWFFILLILVIFGPWIGLLFLAISPVLLVIALIVRLFQNNKSHS